MLTPKEYDFINENQFVPVAAKVAWLNMIYQEIKFVEQHLNDEDRNVPANTLFNIITYIEDKMLESANLE